jgi:superfamily I DNA/RNA helicase
MGQIQPLAEDRARAQTDGVRFMSMVGSKGLTVEAAIVVAAEEGVIPHPEGDLAEERRLMYVALTRARRFQYVTWARVRTGPTARAGTPRVGRLRNESRFLRNGPIKTQDGEKYIEGRWGASVEAA